MIVPSDYDGLKDDRCPEFGSHDFVEMFGVYDPATGRRVLTAEQCAAYAMANGD